MIGSARNEDVARAAERQVPECRVGVWSPESRRVSTISNGSSERAIRAGRVRLGRWGWGSSMYGSLA